MIVLNHPVSRLGRPEGLLFRRSVEICIINLRDAKLYCLSRDSRQVYKTLMYAFARSHQLVNCNAMYVCSLGVTQQEMRRPHVVDNVH